MEGMSLTPTLASVFPSEKWAEWSPRTLVSQPWQQVAHPVWPGPVNVGQSWQPGQERVRETPDWG